MPRQARLDAPGTLHHVMIRGIEGANIFGDNKDREHFVSRVGKIGEATGTRILAWVLMDNHPEWTTIVIIVSYVPIHLPWESGVGENEVRSGSQRRRVSKVRAEIACFLSGEMGISMAEIARRLGVGASAIAMAIRRKTSRNGQQL